MIIQSVFLMIQFAGFELPNMTEQGQKLVIISTMIIVRNLNLKIETQYFQFYHYVTLWLACKLLENMSLECQMNMDHAKRSNT